MAAQTATTSTTSALSVAHARASTNMEGLPLMTVLTAASLPQPPYTHRHSPPHHKQTGIPRKDAHHGQLYYCLASMGGWSFSPGHLVSRGQHMERCTLAYTMAGWRCATPCRGSRCGCRRRPELKAGTPVKAGAPSAGFPPCAGRPQAARAATA
jgi:hypothetical protein